MKGPVPHGAIQNNCAMFEGAAIGICTCNLDGRSQSNAALAK
jgi:hypothetical protein